MPFFIFEQFPILRLSDWRAFLRINRMKFEDRAIRLERNLERLQAKESRTRYSKLPQIIGMFIGLIID